MSALPLVSIITVNYNTYRDVRELLQSIQRLTYPNLEVIVVDNASRENPKPLLTAEFPFIQFIRSYSNLGFAGGNNLGIKNTKGRYCFFLNSDTVLDPSFLEPIIDFMESHPNVGMASPKVLFPDLKTIQYAGARAINQFTGRGKRIGLGEVDHGQYDRCQPTDLGHGAAMIVRREVIEKIGPMPEVYFLYYEEHDWCEQVKKAGYEMYYLGNTRVIHKEGTSTGGDLSPLKVYYMTRNRLLFLRRNASAIALLPALIFFFFLVIPRQTIKYLLSRQIGLLRSFYQGILWNLSHDPYTNNNVNTSTYKVQVRELQEV